MSDKVLIVGGGGREHALAWKLAQSNDIQTVFVSPGNAGTQSEEKVQNVALDISYGDYNDVIVFCMAECIDLVVVGPEIPLAGGIIDNLSKNDIPCFGPNKEVAQIESSKLFSKLFMDKYKIPTAKWNHFQDFQSADEYIDNCNFDKIVVKVSGLAQGKGVFVTSSKEEAKGAVCSIMKERKFGEAGSTVIVEERLYGEEISIFAFSDGNTFFCCPPAQDFKCAKNNNRGPNTGGMGALAPVSNVSNDVLGFLKAIVKKTIKGLQSKGSPFIGLLYTGFILTDNGPKVLEYNCRFGDPETQVLLPLLKSDLYRILRECAGGNLDPSNIIFEREKFAVSVVAASKGYPGLVEKGIKINFSAEEKPPCHLAKLFHSGTKYCGKDIVTNGGRVLCATGFGKSLQEARKSAYELLSNVHFTNMFFRNDIAETACKTDSHYQMGSSSNKYAACGVDIDAGSTLIQMIKPLVKRTYRSGCIAELGSFGGLFDLRACNFNDPILVAGTDGVGTKLKIAQVCKNHRTIGIDLVAMCTNDVIAHGAEPLLFMDYFACGKLNVEEAKEVISGITDGCLMAGCSLIGGETAEMPGVYKTEEYDIAGFVVGVVERNQILPKESTICPGDVLIGLHSSGIHSNGFSLVRRIIDDNGLSYHDTCPFDDTKTLGEALLTPTKIYVKSLLPLMREGKVKAFAHITGGGLLENLPRVIPLNVTCLLEGNSWCVPPVFDWISKSGNVSSQEMLRTFNCGVGGVLVVSESDTNTVLNKLQDLNEPASVIGTLQKRKGIEPQVIVNGFDGRWAQLKTTCTNIRRKVGVLISGSGTNLQALIEHCNRSSSSAQIVLVISNKPDAEGLQKASKAGIPTKVISHKDFTSRLEFDAALLSSLKQGDVELVCLAGFMRILSPTFVDAWPGRLLNIHPSLLPAFKGMDAHKQVLDAGVRVTGCTVHFVISEVDAGAIVAQESVVVKVNDTIESLQQRVKQKEWQLYPKALEMVANGTARLLDNGKVKFC